MQQRLSELVNRFVHIGETRMRDLPIYHRRLQVEAVNFQPWAQGWLGVLITPWFMNVIVLPRDKDRWRSLAPGYRLVQKFPSGEQAFVVGEDEELGSYLFRSLASPMRHFSSQDAARSAARGALQRLMAPTADMETAASHVRGSQQT